MALPLRSQINVKVASESINSLAKGIEKTQKTANSISQTLLKKNKFRREAIAQDKISFFNRRDAVRRREQESVIEAGSLQAASNRTRIPMGSAITESTKGFLGRILDFVGTIFVGWLLTNLPTIIATARNVIKRIQSIVDTLGKFVSDVGSIIFSFFDTLGSVASNIARFDFTDDSGEVRRSFEELEKAVGDLGTHFDDAVKLITTPLGEGPGEEQAPPIGTEYTTTTEGEQPQPTSGTVPSQEGLPPLPPTNTLPGKQHYGAPRDGGKRKHAGVDFDISGPSAKFYSRIGGVVTGNPFRYGADGWGIDIYNRELGVYERIAEASKVLVKPGQVVRPGQAVVQGESGTGVIHYEIRKKISGGFENTVDPISFLNSAKSKPAQPSQPQTPAIPSGGRTPSAPSAPAGSFSGGRWKPLLDVIASGEGGYESVNPGKVVPGLTQMTIAEAWSTAKRVGKSNRGSGAMGRYQLLSDPIGRAKKAGLDPYRDKFSPENQDKIAVYILENIRYGRQWLSGNLRGGDAAFAQGIADEWAGVPNLSGKYSYSGQGGKVKASSVRAALNQVKSGSSTQQAQVAAQPSTPAAEVSAPLTREQALAVAQVSQPPTNAPGQMQALTPERMGNQVVVAPQQLAPQVSQQAPMAGKQYSISEPQNLLNKFMLTRLLLDLAYT